MFLELSGAFAEATERAAKEAEPVERSSKTSPGSAPLMKGMYDRIEVNDLRKKGITPQPYDCRTKENVVKLTG